MDEFSTSLLVQAFACNARITGMTAANTQAVLRGTPPAFAWTDFKNEADQLEWLASAIQERGRG